MIAVVIGPTGLVGAEVTRRLLEDPEVQRVVAVSRKPLAEHPKLGQVLIAGLAELPARAAELKGDIYFCCLGTTIKDAGSREAFRKVDHAAVLDFGRIAKSHNARSFAVVTAAGANPASPVFYSRVKGEVETALRQLGLTRLVIFRPGLLIGDRRSFRPAERLMIAAFRALSGLLPRYWLKRSATEVQRLAERLIVEGKQMAFGTFVISSEAI